MRRIILALILFSTQAAHAGFDIATFGDTGLINGVGQYNNDPPTGSFTSGGQQFFNDYNPKYGSWSGFSVSSMTDTTTAGYTNQYSAITGGGNGDPYYGVVFGSASINLSGYAYSIDLTNTTYAYLSMLNGDQFAEKFGVGAYFRVVMTGYSGLNDTGSTTGAVTYSLADYSSATSSPVDTWSTVSLLGLGSAKSIGFSFQSTDVGQFGINTPTYVAVDNLEMTPSLVPEPGSWLLCVAGLGIAAAVRRRRLVRSARV